MAGNHLRRSMVRGHAKSGINGDVKIAKHVSSGRHMRRKLMRLNTRGSSDLYLMQHQVVQQQMCGMFWITLEKSSRYVVQLHIFVPVFFRIRNKNKKFLPFLKVRFSLFLVFLVKKSNRQK